MAGLVRFGVSLEEELLSQFDKHLREKGYTNRSEAIRDLIREGLVKKEWKEDEGVCGAIILVYNHHQRELVNQLMDIQHHYHEHILSTQHLHLDEDNCLEIVAVKGRAKEIERLYGRLKSLRGVKHGELAKATTGKRLL